jgi:hypothetical protein
MLMATFFTHCDRKPVVVVVVAAVVVVVGSGLKDLSQRV